MRLHVEHLAYRGRELSVRQKEVLVLEQNELRLGLAHFFEGDDILLLGGYFVFWLLDLVQPKRTVVLVAFDAVYYLLRGVKRNGVHQVAEHEEICVVVAVHSDWVEPELLAILAASVHE